MKYHTGVSAEWIRIIWAQFGGQVLGTPGLTALTFRRRIKSRLPFAGIIRSLPYSTRFQDKSEIEIV